MNTPISDELENIAKIIVNSAYKIHKTLGPGLLERVYEVAMEHELKKSGLRVERQKLFPIVYDGIEFEDCLRLDLLVEDSVVIELKAVDQINPVWQAQVLSHMTLLEKRLGFLINFNVPIIKLGIKRFIK